MQIMAYTYNSIHENIDNREFGATGATRGRTGRFCAKYSQKIEGRALRQNMHHSYHSLDQLVQTLGSHPTSSKSQELRESSLPSRNPRMMNRHLAKNRGIEL